MASDELLKALQAVTDEASLIRFVELLIADRQSVDSLPLTADGFRGRWASQTITDFLQAAASWAGDSAFDERPGPKPANPWQLFATFLSAGRGYE